MLANFFLVNVQVLRKAIQLCNLFNTCREKHIKSHVFLEKKKLKGGKKRNLGGRKRPTLKFSNSPALGAGSLSPPPGSPLSTGTLGGSPPVVGLGAGSDSCAPIPPRPPLAHRCLGGSCSLEVRCRPRWQHSGLTWRVYAGAPLPFPLRFKTTATKSFCGRG